MEQANINEGKRRAYYKSRRKALEKIHDRMIDKQIKNEGGNREALEEEYEEIRDDQLAKEWKSFGHTARDWVKTKIVFFNEAGKPIAMKVDEYRKMKTDEKKQQLKDAVAIATDKKYAK